MLCQAFCHYAQSAERIAHSVLSFYYLHRNLSKSFSLRLQIAYFTPTCSLHKFMDTAIHALRLALCALRFPLDFHEPMVYFSCFVGGSSRGRTHDSGSCYGGSNPPPPATAVKRYWLSVISYRKNISRYSAHLSLVRHNSEYPSPATVTL